MPGAETRGEYSRMREDDRGTSLRRSRERPTSTSAVVEVVHVLYLMSSVPVFTLRPVQGILILKCEPSRVTVRVSRSHQLQGSRPSRRPSPRSVRTTTVFRRDTTSLSVVDMLQPSARVRPPQMTLATPFCEQPLHTGGCSAEPVPRWTRALAPRILVLSIDRYEPASLFLCPPHARARLTSSPGHLLRGRSAGV